MKKAYLNSSVEILKFDEKEDIVVTSIVPDAFAGDNELDNYFEEVNGGMSVS